MNVVEIFDVTNDDKITHNNQMETEENDEVAVDSPKNKGKMEVDENEATMTLENNHNANNSNAALYEGKQILTYDFSVYWFGDMNECIYSSPW